MHVYVCMLCIQFDMYDEHHFMNTNVCWYAILQEDVVFTIRLYSFIYFFSYIRSLILIYVLKSLFSIFPLFAFSKKKERKRKTKK